jgi:hypothetical protein
MISFPHISRWNLGSRPNPDLNIPCIIGGVFLNEILDACPV